MGRREKPLYSLSRGHLHSGRVPSVAPTNTRMFYHDAASPGDPWQHHLSLSPPCRGVAVVGCCG